MRKSGIEIETLPPILTLERVAELAGVTRRTVRDWVKRGRLAGSRARKGRAGKIRMYFKTVDVLRALGVEVGGE